MSKAVRYGGLDRMKLGVSFLVIAIHTSPLLSINGSGDFILTRVIGRVAVPFFVMTTGFFILPRYVFDKSRVKTF